MSRLFFTFTTLALLVALACATTSQLNVWPLPHTVTQTKGTPSSLSPDFQFVTESKSQVLARAFKRYNELVFLRPLSATVDVKDAIKTLVVTVGTDDETLVNLVDESYLLTIQGSQAAINADSIWGAMRALETFSQLVHYSTEANVYQVPASPLTIQDVPRFPYRGILMDTSRHYQPVRMLKQLLNSMEVAKFNVLHWHIVDAQSFPLQSKAFPKLWNGAYSEDERYTQEDVADLISYAKDRGIRVIPEFDGPGHAYAWGIGYPEVLPANYTTAKGCLNKCPPEYGNPCDVPLDPSKKATYDLVQGLYNELLAGAAGKGVFPDTYFHLGGDEVNQECWADSTEIKDWMKTMNFTTLDDTYMYFVNKAHDFTFANKRTPINWEEVWLHFGTRLDKRAIIHIWLHYETMSDVAKAGYHSILSKGFYLDALSTNWTTYYNTEPLQWLDKQYEQSLLGGVACMWGETVDASDVLSTIWPRAGAIAERLWSPQSVSDVTAAEPRYASFRCLLNERGIGAAPSKLTGREAPTEPGSCKRQ